MIRVLLIDDHPVVANGLESTLRSHSIDLAGQATKPVDIAECLSRLRPQVVVSESRLQGVDILCEIAELLQDSSAPAVVVFSAFDDFSHIARAAAIGVHEYILKNRPLRELVDAVQQAAGKNPASENGLVATARGRLRRPRQFVRNDIPLTRRELQVLQHIAMGLSNREVGTSLDVSLETVKEHVQNILRKLDVNDRTQAAVWAVRKNLV